MPSYLIIWVVVFTSWWKRCMQQNFKI